MGHTSRHKDKLLNRIRRIRGQLNAVEAGLESEADCATVLQTLVSCRGALNAMVVEVSQLRGRICGIYFLQIFGTLKLDWTLSRRD